jgi:hypothetical protein
MQTESAALSAVPVDRNEPKNADDVGFVLAGALQSWCAEGDPRRLRRMLLALLSARDDE